MPCAATGMQREILNFSEVSEARERQTPYETTSMWNLKCGTDDSTYRTETDSQTWKTAVWLPRGKGRDGWGVWGS